MKFGRWAIKLKDTHTPVLWRRSYCIAPAAGEPTTTSIYVYYVGPFDLGRRQAVLTNLPLFVLFLHIANH
jgi:hypothetical protein